MQKVISAALLIIICFGNVISQQKSPCPTPSPTPSVPEKGQSVKAAPGTIQTTSVSRSRKHWKSRAFRMAKLRKENRRLRAIIARQKHMLAKKTRLRKSKRPLIAVVPTIAATPTLTDSQLQTIAQQVYAKMKDDNFTVALRKSDMDKLESMIKEKSSQSSNQSESVDPNSRGLFARAWDSVLGIAVGTYTTVDEWILNHPYLFGSILLMAALVLLAITIMRRGKSGNEEPREWFAWIKKPDAPKSPVPSSDDFTHVGIRQPKPTNGNTLYEQYADVNNAAEVEPIPSLEDLKNASESIEQSEGEITEQNAEAIEVKEEQKRTYTIAQPLTTE